MEETKPVVVYDGECPFCIDQIDKFKKLDTDSKLEFVPKQNPEITDRFPILLQSKFETGIRFIRADGNIEIGADAVYQICKRLPLYKPVAWLYAVPGLKQIAQICYGYISENRKRFAGK